MGSTKIKPAETTEIETTKPKTKKATKPEAESPESTTSTKKSKSTKAATAVSRTRSKAYVKARSQVDKTKLYEIDDAIALVRKLSRPNHKTLTVDINYKEEGFSTEVALPHATGKTIKVEIVTEDLLKQFDQGEYNFDILIAAPEMMGKIAKYAKFLGPKGLMPNPKNGTVTKDPAKRKKELEAGKQAVKTERKAPIIHLQIGTTDLTDAQIKDNLTSLVKAIQPTKVKRLTLSSTMSPGVKINPATIVVIE